MVKSNTNQGQKMSNGIKVTFGKFERVSAWDTDRVATVYADGERVGTVESQQGTGDRYDGSTVVEMYYFTGDSCGDCSVRLFGRGRRLLTSSAAKRVLKSEVAELLGGLQ